MFKRKLFLDEASLLDNVTRGNLGEVTVTIVDDDRKHKIINAIHSYFYRTCKVKSSVSIRIHCLFNHN